MENKKDSFVFYRSFFEALGDLPNENQLEIYQAISNFSLNFQEPELSGISKTIFTLIRPQLAANKTKYENGCLGGKHGHKGGRPKKEKTPKKPLDNPKLTPNDNVNDNVNDKEDKKTKAKKLAEEKEKILKRIFEELYTIFKDGSKIIKFPFDDLKSRFENCCIDLKPQGGYKYLKQQVVDYIAYLAVATWRKKAAFKVWINQIELYANDWVEEATRERESQRKPGEKESPSEPEMTEQEREKWKFTRAATALAIKLGVNPSRLTKEQLKQIRI